MATSSRAPTVGECANTITDFIVPLFFCPSSPDRWLGGAPPASSSAVPGVWANMLTFSAGPRFCIGFKFAILESVLALARGCYLFFFLLTPGCWLG